MTDEPLGEQAGGTPGAQNLIHHMCQFNSAEELAQAAGRFAREGVAAGEPVLCIASETTNRAVRDAAGDYADRIAFRDAPRYTDMPARRFEDFRRYVTERGAGGQRVRAMGEPLCDGDWEPRRREWHRVEAAINAVLHGRPLWLVCLYDGQRLDPAELREARRTHPRLWSAGDGLRGSTDYTDPVTYAAGQDDAELAEPGDLLAERPVVAERLRELRELVARLSSAYGLPAERAEDFVFAVNEVASNALRHAAGDRQVRLWGTRMGLVCDVVDSGGGFGDHSPATSRRKPRPGPGVVCGWRGNAAICWRSVANRPGARCGCTWRPSGPEAEQAGAKRESIPQIRPI